MKAHVAVVFALALVGCAHSSDLTDSLATGATATTYTLSITASASTIRVGEELTLLATLRDAKGVVQNQTERVVWTSQSPEIAQVTEDGYPVGRIKGRSPGVAVIVATVAGQAQSISIAVTPLPQQSGSAIVIESFSVIEFQYPSQPGHWYYAPLVRVRETGVGNTSAITSYYFDIPGIAPSPLCRTYRRLALGATLDLFREVYGDYGFTIDQSGARATGTVATAIITYVDGSSPPMTISAKGPIISGALPTTYTGGTVDWTCT